MRKVLVWSPKGGVGKSLIVHQLVLNFDYTGVENDSYGSLSYRLPDGARIFDGTFDHNQNTVFDFGGFDSKALRQTITICDVVIVPFIPIKDSLQATVDAIPLLKQYKKPLLFVCNLYNLVNPSYESEEKIKSSFEKALGSPPEILKMPWSKAFIRAINQDFGVLKKAESNPFLARNYRVASAAVLELQKNIERIVENGGR